VLIDWFTVAAQIVNFLVLVALMKHFLYGPLIHAIDAREGRIAAQLAEADDKNRQADLKTGQVQTQIAELENRGAQMIAEAREEADRQRHELVRAARDSVRSLETRWREDVRLEKTAFFDEVRRVAATEILSITRRALADLASADIQRSAVEAFLEKLRSADISLLKGLAGGDIVVVSARDLSPELQRQVQETIELRLGSPVPLRFERAPEMAWGIELRGEGQRIGWTPDGYLDSLEEKLKSALDQRVELGQPLATE
jgi:F-type H+-transporting ATPase subunit b